MILQLLEQSLINRCLIHQTRYISIIHVSSAKETRNVLKLDCVFFISESIEYLTGKKIV